MKNLLLIAAMAGVFSCSSPSGSIPVDHKGTGQETPTDSKQTAEPEDIVSARPDSAQPRADSSFLGKKRAKGIDFYAVGQEPRWALDMDTAYNFSFKSYDGVEIGSPPVSGTTSPDGKTTSYHASVEMGELAITITREACMDTMSGEKFPCKVQVRIKRGVDKDFRTFEGCGRFL